MAIDSGENTLADAAVSSVVTANRSESESSSSTSEEYHSATEEQEVENDEGQQDSEGPVEHEHEVGYVDLLSNITSTPALSQNNIDPLHPVRYS